MSFWKQAIIAEDEINVSVILTSKYKVIIKNFIIPIFWFPVFFLWYRSSHKRCSMNKNFTKFTGKHLCQSIFLNKCRPQALLLIDFEVKKFVKGLLGVLLKAFFQMTIFSLICDNSCDSKTRGFMTSPRYNSLIV